MAKKFDGVIEAVHYSCNGQIDFVRLYERRGVTYSDRVLLDRADLLERLKKGQTFSIGQRKEFLGSTFDLGKSVRTVEKDGKAYITTNGTTDRDNLEDTPAL